MGRKREGRKKERRKGRARGRRRRRRKGRMEDRTMIDDYSPQRAIPMMIIILKKRMRHSYGMLVFSRLMVRPRQMMITIRHRMTLLTTTRPLTRRRKRKRRKRRRRRRRRRRRNLNHVVPGRCT